MDGADPACKNFFFVARHLNASSVRRLSVDVILAVTIRSFSARPHSTPI